MSYNSHPRFVMSGDMNNDTYLDIVVANPGIDKIGIFYGYGDGNFLNQTLYSTGFLSEPYSVTINDFNGDSLLDIAVANHGTNSIGILLSLGSGNFTEARFFSLDFSSPVSIISADFNNDNILDLATANYETSNIDVLMGHGDGSFSIHITYSTGYDSLPYFVQVGDFNNDSRLDIAVANSGTNNVGIFLGFGDGTFQIQIVFSTGYNSFPQSILIIDINNDDVLDIIVANYGSSSIGMLFGYGNGSFQIVKNYFLDSKYHPSSLIIIGAHQNSQYDIAILDSNLGIVLVLEGSNNSHTISKEIYSTGFQSLPLSITAGDFNRDHILDFAVVNTGNNDVSVFLRYHLKLFSQQTIYPTTDYSNPQMVVFGDFNNDNHTDVAVLNKATSTVGIFLGYGNGTLTNAVIYSVGNGSNPVSIATTDFNDDHILDIVTANTATNNVALLFGNGDGSFGNLTTCSTRNGSSPYAVVVNDFNNDHHADIVVANYASNEIAVFLGYGNGSFQEPIQYACGQDSNPRVIAFGDFNNDNTLDIVVANYGSYTIGVLLGYGNGTFRKTAEYLTGENVSPLWVVTGDFNNDKKIDVVALNYPSGDIVIFQGNGDGTLKNPILYSTGEGTFSRSLAVGDLNNDNQLDIMSANYGTNSIGILYGYGNGTFAEVTTYFIEDGFQPLSVACANLNGDQWLDIVAVYVQRSSIGLLFGLGYTYTAKELTYTTGSGSHPNSISISDFNNDGNLDVAIANSGNDNIGIRLGFGNGSFETETTFFIGSGSDPQFITVTDINTDNKMDIIAASPASDAIIVLYGHGDGTFLRQESYSTGDQSQPSSIAFADFNNDNISDIIVSNQGIDSLGVFLSFDYATFGHQTIYKTGFDSSSYSVATGDFNHDNKQDIVVVNYHRSNIGIFLGYGNDTFSAQTVYSTGYQSQPMCVAIGDFNHDNNLDIVVTNSGTNNIGVFFGYGNGSFSSQTIFPVGSNAFSHGIAVGDLNHDTHVDIVIASSRSNNVGIFFGYGNGSFSTILTYSMGSASYPLSVSIGDLNNDNNSDIIAANYRQNNIGVLFGDGNGGFPKLIKLSTDDASNPTSVGIHDMNNDGLMDIVVSNEGTDSIGIFLGYGNGSFAGQKIYSMTSGSLPYCLSIADFNNDSYLDVAAANFGSNSIGVLFGYGDGTFTDELEISTGDGSGPNWLAIADFNADYQLDIVVANWGSDSMLILLQDGHKPFLNQVTHSTGDNSQPCSVAVGDFNNDHKMDIVVANYGNDNVGILLGYGNGTFQNQSIYTTGSGSGPCSVAVGDLNNDNQSDIVVANLLTNDISILIGFGNGTFSTQNSYSTGNDSRPIMVSISDVNNDNRLDIIVVNNINNNVLIFFGYGNGTFIQKQSFLMGYQASTSSVALGDFNNDTWIDMVVSNSGTDTVEILLQTC